MTHRNRQEGAVADIPIWRSKDREAAANHFACRPVYEASRVTERCLAGQEEFLPRKSECSKGGDNLWLVCPPSRLQNGCSWSLETTLIRV